MGIKGLLKFYKIFKQLRIDPDDGIIRSKYGIRYLLFSDDSILAIEDELRDIVGKDVAKGLTYRIGYEAGMRFAKPFREIFMGEESSRIGRKCAEFAQIAGWGKHKICGSLESGKAIVIVYDSPLSGLKSSEKEPVCNFHCGLLAGSASAITGRRVVGEEVNCAAKGDDFCKFILKFKNDGRY